MSSNSLTVDLKQLMREHRLVYEVLDSPDVLFCEMTDGLNPFKFDRLDWAPGLVECRFLLFDSDGKLVAHRQRIVDGQLLTATLNLLPLELIRDRVKELKHQTHTRE